MNEKPQLILVAITALILLFVVVVRYGQLSGWWLSRKTANQVAVEMTHAHAIVIMLESDARRELDDETRMAIIAVRDMAAGKFNALAKQYNHLSGENVPLLELSLDKEYSEWVLTDKTPQPLTDP